jgi:hypothetical protein
MKKHGTLTERRPSVLSQEACDIVSNTFSSCKDQNLVVLILHNLLEMLGHPIALLELRYNLNNLSDSVVSRQLHGTDIDLDEVVQVI